MPTCWFCGEDVERVHLCMKCEQEFCDQHIAQADHDCPGTPVLNPFKLPNSPLPHVPPSPGTKYQCWFCGMIDARAERCPLCRQWFCPSHAQPAAHDCLGFTVPNPFEFAPESPSFSATQIMLPPELFLSRVGKIALDNERAGQIAAKIMDVYRKCIEEPEKASEVDPELGEIYLRDPNVIWLINSHALGDRYADKLNRDPLARNLLKWLKGFGSRLEFIQQICEELQISEKQLTLQRLLAYHFSYLTDFPQVVIAQEINQEGGQPAEEPRIILKDDVQFRKESLITFTEQAYQEGEREIGGYLIGRRDPGGAIKEVTRYIPLENAHPVTPTVNLNAPKNVVELESCDPLLQDFFRITDSLDATEEAIVGFAHSRPQGFFPSNSREDITNHIREKFFASFLHINLPLPSNDKLHLMVHMSQFNPQQIANLLLALEITINASDTFDQVMNAIFQHVPDQWADLRTQLQIILSAHQNQATNFEFHLVPYLNVVVSPVMRFVSVVDYLLEKATEDDNSLEIKEVFYRILTRDE